MAAVSVALQDFLPSQECARGSYMGSQGCPCWVHVWALQTFGICAWVFVVCSTVCEAVAPGTAMGVVYIHFRGSPAIGLEQLVNL